MARGVNKVIAIGNLGQEPEIRYTPSGSPVANFSIAVSESWTDKNTGQKQERTEWIKCVAFNKLAEIIQQYVHKGSKVYVEGKLQTRKWQAQDGSDRYSTEVVINDMQMQDSKNGGQQQGAPHAPNNGGGYGQNMPPQGAPQNQQRQQQCQGGQRQQNGYANAQNGQYGSPQQGAPAGGFDDFSDEIPF